MSSCVLSVCFTAIRSELGAVAQCRLFTAPLARAMQITAYEVFLR
jgi:hypothetical protein